MKEIQSQDLKLTLLIESFQFYYDNILKPDHVKQVQVASNNKVPGTIEKDFWPNNKLLKETWDDENEEDETGMVQIFDEKLRVHELKHCICNFWTL